MGLIIGLSIGSALLLLIVFGVFIAKIRKKQNVSFIAEPSRRSSERELTGIIPNVNTNYNPKTTETTAADHERMQSLWLRNGAGFMPIHPAVIDNIYAPENM